MTQKILGLDVGIASVGVGMLFLDEHSEQGSIICHGVHLFDRAETSDGESLALPYRANRSSRRVTRRRAGRLLKIRKLFQQHGLNFYPEIILAETRDFMFRMSKEESSPWHLRSRALKHRLSDMELCQVLYHIAKHRGFKSNKKDEILSPEAKEKDRDDTQKMLLYANSLADRMNQAGCETPGEFFYKTGICEQQKVRNTEGDYSHTILRDLHRQEVALIFERQRGFGASWATSELEAAYVEHAFSQRPLQSVRDMVGHCLLEETELRAAKHSRSGELFVLWAKINHLRIIDNQGNARELTSEQRAVLFQLAHQNKETSYTAIRRALGLPIEERFNNVRYDVKKKAKSSRKKSTEVVGDLVQVEEKAPDWESIVKAAEKDVTWITMLGYYRLKNILPKPSSAQVQSHWDKIADILAFEQAVDAIREQLLEHQAVLQLSVEQIEALCTISDFKGTVGHSVKAIGRLLPHLEAGETYDKAVLLTYGIKSCQRSDKLPPFPTTTNPIVNRALAQVRKIINATISKYGMPDRIHVEMARDISKSKKDRDKIHQEQQENERQNSLDRKAIAEDFPGVSPLVHRLWKEQGTLCLYSGKHIFASQLSDGTSVQVDHILPRHRSFDNSYMNKVLVLTRENQNKKERTTSEYFFQDKSEQAWDELLVRAASLPKAKRDRLMNKTFNEREQEWKERHLNDTRWISRAVLNHIQKNLALPGDPNSKKVMAVNGRITAELRHAWGFSRKNRINPRHHAVDALVVAACTERMVQKVTRFNKYDARARGLELYAPKPWPSFREDVLRLTYDNPNWIISRLANRKVTGEINGPNPVKTRKDEKGQERKIERLALTKVNSNKLENLIDKDGRNRWLYNTLLNTLANANNEPEKAFKPPFTITMLSGQTRLIRKVSLWGDRVMSGRRLRGGVTDNGSQIRVDVFQKKGKFYLVPVFSWHFRTGELPMGYCKQGTPQDDWPKVDDTFEYQFSLFKNDYVRIVKTNGEMIAGYYKGTHISMGQINLQAHDAADTINCPHPGVFSLKAFEKLQVDYFGNLSGPIREKERPPVRWRKKSRVANRSCSKTCPPVLTS